MRISIPLLGSLAVAALFSAGCAGPEQKLGRGLNNLTEFARLGEIRRSMEESSLWDNSEVAYTTGFFRGFDRSFARTVVGAFEVLTFPFPGYEPYLRPGNELFPDMAVNPVYPESYRPHFIADPSFGPDAEVGFSGGDIAPFAPGSRFRIFDY